MSVRQSSTKLTLTVVYTLCVLLVCLSNHAAHFTAGQTASRTALTKASTKAPSTANSTANSTVPEKPPTNETSATEATSTTVKSKPPMPIFIIIIIISTVVVLTIGVIIAVAIKTTRRRNRRVTSPMPRKDQLDILPLAGEQTDAGNTTDDEDDYLTPVSVSRVVSRASQVRTTLRRSHESSETGREEGDEDVEAGEDYENVPSLDDGEDYENVKSPLEQPKPAESDKEPSSATTSNEMYVNEMGDEGLYENVGARYANVDQQRHKLITRSESVDSNTEEYDYPNMRDFTGLVINPPGSN